MVQLAPGLRWVTRGQGHRPLTGSKTLDFSLNVDVCSIGAGLDSIQKDQGSGEDSQAPIFRNRHIAGDMDDAGPFGFFLPQLAGDLAPGFVGEVHQVSAELFPIEADDQPQVTGTFNGGQGAADAVSEQHLAGGDAHAFALDPYPRRGVPSIAMEGAIGLAELDPQQHGDPGKVAVPGEELEPRLFTAARLRRQQQAEDQGSDADFLYVSAHR